MQRVLLIAIVFLSLSSALPAQQPSLKYVVSFADRANHKIAVKMMIPAPTKDSFELMMATWTPGSYLIREYARQVDQVTPATGSDPAVTVQKSSKNRWLVKCVRGKDVELVYDVYCREMSVRSNWVDSDMAVLCGAAFILTVSNPDPSPAAVEHHVQFQMPPEWARSVTSLSLIEGQQHTYKAASFDELADSPIICGNPVLQDFDAGGSSHVLASMGDASLWNTAQAAADVQKIVAQQQKFWGTVPYRKYSFLNVICESSGGLEHDNSTLVMTSRWNFRDKEKYEDWLSLMSHEFFHTWNIRRLRPVNLSPYDYERENYTRSLWIAEGVTSYYEDLMLVRAGLIDEAAYLKRLSKQIEKLQTTPGRLEQSLAESSFDTWIKFYRPDENSSNSRVSYYVKGAVVGFLLDARIREVTNDAKSLDDVMRLLYQRHSGPTGYSDAQFLAMVSEVAGTDMTAWLAQHVETTDELKYEPALNWLGLQFPSDENAAELKDGEIPAPPADPASHKKTDGTLAKKEGPSKTPVWVGAQTSEASGSIVATGVTQGTPAYAAGLNVDDEIVGINQYRANPKSWKDQLAQIGVGHTIKLLISRRGELRTIELKLEEEPKVKWALKTLPKASDEQKTRLKKWLSQ
jgi:predicted metalloprotease with PDZ domain